MFGVFGLCVCVCVCVAHREGIDEGQNQEILMLMRNYLGANMRLYSARLYHYSSLFVFDYLKVLRVNYKVKVWVR